MKTSPRMNSFFSFTIFFPFFNTMLTLEKASFDNVQQQLTTAATQQIGVHSFFESQFFALWSYNGTMGHTYT